MFPPPPLKFRTVGFPQYGFKRQVDADLRGKKSIDTTPQSASTNPCGPRGHVIGTALRTLSSRDPWLTDRLYCPAGSMRTMASSEPLLTAERLIFFVHPALRSRVGPQFNLRVCSYMPSPLPRWTDREQTTVTSPTTLVFAVSAEARHPHAAARWFSRGCVTRLTQVRLRYGLHDCSPFTNKDFDYRAFAGRVAPNRRRL